MKMTTFLLFATAALGEALTCDSIKVSESGGWMPVSTAPRDGTVIEMLQTYGIAPTYGLFRWTGDWPPWAKVDDQRAGYSNSRCLFWRPYTKTGKYVDPTHGAQYTNKYWCDAMKRPYDPKTDRCR